MKPYVCIGLSYRRAPRGQPCFTFPSDRRIAINSTYVVRICALRRNFGLNPGIFGRKTSDWDSAQRASGIKVSYPAGDQTREIVTLPHTGRLIYFVKSKEIMLHYRHYKVHIST